MMTNALVDRTDHTPWLWWGLGLLAIVAPTLIAFHEPPSVTFFNQALAVLGWGVFIVALGQQPAAQARPGLAASAVTALSLMWLVHAVEALGSAFAWGALPGGLGLMGAGMSLAAMVALRAGWRSGQSNQRDAVLDVFFGALTIAGVLGMVLSLIQVFHPAWADGTFIAEPTMPGRAVGNLRQPNHLSTLLVWSCCGVGWLGARRRLPAWLASGLLAMFIWGIVLTASRTGMIGMGFLALWGLLDRRLPPLLRKALIAAPVIYGVFWGAMWLVAYADKSVTFAAEARLHDHSDISSSRFKIWANVIELIKQNPWLGVGYGEFNIAWTLTPFPTRPVAFFDHTHNVLFQWAVEFGLPMALLLAGLCLWGFWALVAGANGGLDGDGPADDTGSSVIGACTVMVAIAGLHSLLEYPLWYSYFLLPTAFAWGLGLGVKAKASAPEAAQQTPAPAGQLMSAAGGVMAALSIWCTLDYLAAVNIYAPYKSAGPLEERIQFGKKMPWWGYQADYADVTSPDDEDPSKPPVDFRRTLHNLLDARLMVAYARSLAEHGDVDKARYVVERLKEFRNPMADSFLAVCKTQLEAGEEPPFQCEPPAGHYTWRDILPPSQ
ncbi:MAG: Wzy polymerase domain-containing protein [Aquabacterium sp.]